MPQLRNFINSTIDHHSGNLEKVNQDLIKSEFMVNNVSEIWNGKEKLDENGLLELILSYFGELGWELDKIIYFAEFTRREGEFSKQIDKLILKK